MWVSPDPGETVDRATGEEREKALYVDEMTRPLAVGIGRDELPVHVDLDFFDGRKGGHMSISGISGVATKTSFALFFLRMLSAREHAGIVGEGAANMRVLVFNVKGEDLLWLDRPNSRFDDGAREQWAMLGVEPAPFPSVAFWAPPKRRSGEVVLPDTGGRLEGIEVFSWTPREFIDDDLLQFCFTDANDSKNQLPFIRERVQAQLKRFAVNVAGRPGAVVLRDPSQTPGGRWGAQEVAAGPGEPIIEDLASLVTALEVFLEPDDGGEPDAAWTRASHAEHGLGVHAASARRGVPPRAPRARRRVSAHRPSIGDGHRRRDPVAARAGAAFRRGRPAQRDVPPRRRRPASGCRCRSSCSTSSTSTRRAMGTGPLKDMLIDIAQRGRSLGVLLVGAQQTASRVASEVLENAAIRVSGRLDAAEAERAEYGWMLPSTRARARLLKPGTMVISQPAIPVPLVVTFPFPPWATRKEEVDDTAGADPFAGL